MNYQAYLIDGIIIWNAARAAAAIKSGKMTLRTFDIRMQEKVLDIIIMVQDFVLTLHGFIEIR